MHLILRTVKDKRPKPPNNDPNNSQEKEVFKKRIRESIEYIETGGTGRATDEQQRNIEDLTDRVNRMASKYTHSFIRSTHNARLMDDRSMMLLGDSAALLVTSKPDEAQMC